MYIDNIIMRSNNMEKHYIIDQINELIRIILKIKELQKRPQGRRRFEPKRFRRGQR